MLKKIRAADDLLSKSVAKLHNPFLNRIMLFMTFLGDGGKIWFFLIAIILYFKRSVYLGFSLCLSLGLAFLSSEIIVKRLVGRIRPCHKLENQSLILKKIPDFYSFPSSHSASSFAVVTASYMLLGTGITVFMLIIAVGVAFSRFYLQAHYLTDVICGIVFGVVSGIIMVNLMYVIFHAIDPMLTVV